MARLSIRPLLRAIARQMADLGYERNYRRAIIEGLDVSPEARYARAEAQGFTNPQYHATRTDFPSFRPDGPYEMGIHTGSHPDAANGRLVHPIALKHLIETGQSAKLADRFRYSQIIPLLMRARGVATTPDLGHFASPGSFVQHASRNNDFLFFSKPGRRPHPEVRMPPGAFEELLAEALRMRDIPLRSPKEWPRAVRDILRKYNIDTIAYKNDSELVGDKSHMGLYPEQYRSVHAMFNPRRQHMRDLLAGLGAGLAGYSAADLAERSEH